MLHGLYILLDDDVGHPMYAQPEPEELDPELWQRACEHVLAALEGDADRRSTLDDDEVCVAIHIRPRLGLSFLAFVDEDVAPDEAQRYVDAIARTYLQEVDDPRHPEEAGLEELLMEVVPPWEE